MSLILSTELTDDLKVKQSATRLLNSMKMEARAQFDAAWKKREGGAVVNKTVEECQAFWNAMGASGTLAMEAHSKLQELIYMVDNTWIPLLPTYSYVKNANGTITIL